MSGLVPIRTPTFQSSGRTALAGDGAESQTRAEEPSAAIVGRRPAVEQRAIPGDTRRRPAAGRDTTAVSRGAGAFVDDAERVGDDGAGDDASDGFAVNDNGQNRALGLGRRRFGTR